VEQAVDALERPPHLAPVGDVGRHDLHLEVGDRVQRDVGRNRDTHPVAARDERPREVGPDEPGRPRDERGGHLRASCQDGDH
jgi:hypothetical protein